MAETSMNFGPEWIRTLTESKGSSTKSQGRSSFVPSGPRYNKEEMFERFQRMLRQEDVSHESLLFPPDYLDPEYCRLEPSLKRHSLDAAEDVGNSSPANSEASLRFYKKEGLLACLAEESAISETPFEIQQHRHRNNNNNTESNSGKGPRSYERSMSDRGGGGDRRSGGSCNKWYERSNTMDEKLNGLATSPRKTYTRVPYDDWRKVPPGQTKEDEWRKQQSQPTANSSRWSVWRSPLDNNNGPSLPGENSRSVFPKSNALGGSSPNSSSKSPKWREESSYSNKSSSRGGFLSRGGLHHGFRRRQESDTLPEWAHEDVPLDKLGGTFDSAGKFTQPFKVVGVPMGNGEEGGRSEDDKKKANLLSNSNGKAGSGSPERCFKEEPSDLAPPPLLPPEKVEEPKLHISEEPPNILSMLDEGSKGGLSGRVGPPPICPSEEYKWIYLDPEGKTQGSFPSIQMLDWFQKGYFPPDLRLRRTIDKRFMALSEFTKLVGGYIPFLPGIQFPPLEPAEDEAQKLQQQMREQATYMRQLQAQLLMQQLVQQEQQFMSRPDPHLLNKLVQMLGPNAPAPPLPGPPLINGPEALGPLQQPHPPAGDPIKQLLAQQQSIRPPFPPPSDVVVPPPQAPLPPIDKPNNNYDPIKSLLAQLQLNSPAAAPSGSNYFTAPLEPSSERPPEAAALPQPPPPLPSRPNNASSIWDLPFKGSSEQIWSGSQQQQCSSEEMAFQLQQKEELLKQEELLKRQEMEKQEAFLRQQEELEKQKEDLRRQQEEFEKQQELLFRQKAQMNGASPPPEEEDSSKRQMESLEDFEDFVKPKLSEKKDRKNRKAEEKRKSREAKKSDVSSQPQKYIPGMEGSQKPSEPIVAGGALLEDYEEEEEEPPHVESQEDALSRLREEQQAVLMEKPPVVQTRLAPWAKKVEEAASSELSLAEIQKLEAEREACLQREAQMREEEEAAAASSLALLIKEEPLITPKTKWSQNTQAEDFLQIVQEEYRLEKARQEKEKKNKKIRQKDIGLVQASVWGAASGNLSWASKTSSNIAQPPPSAAATTPSTQSQKQQTVKNVVAGGFWEDSPPSTQQQQPTQPKSNSDPPANNSNKSKKSGKKSKEDSSSQRNPFQDWCTNALKSYNVQVDIPTFLSFLESIESPFEVNDYISSYIGEGKGPKSFAKEYLERRSKWKNSLKTANARWEDNLMAPANAINPGESSEFTTVKNSKSKKQRTKGGQKKMMDMSHLLGFSVASDRVNAGELDLPN